MSIQPATWRQEARQYFRHVRHRRGRLGKLWYTRQCLSGWAERAWTHLAAHLHRQERHMFAFTVADITNLFKDYAPW